MSINKQILLTIILLIGTIVLFSFSNIDIFIQNYFFDRTTGTWILNRDLEPYKFIFYDGSLVDSIDSNKDYSQNNNIVTKNITIFRTLSILSIISL